MSNAVPFTYLIGWSNHGTYYYGVRYANECHPSDLWTVYYTSSKYVRMFREDHGDPDIIQIRKTFDNKESARLWESNVLRRLNAKDSNSWLNKSDTMAPPVMYGNDNPSSRPDVNAKRIDSLIRYWESDEASLRKSSISDRMVNDNPAKQADVRDKISKKKKEWWDNDLRKQAQSEQFKENNPNHIPGVQKKISIKRDEYWADERNRKARSEKYSGKGNPAYGKKQERVICEHCGKDVAISMYHRWHAEKCKFKE